MRRFYALESVFNGNPPPEDTDLLKVCERFGICWSDKQVYPETSGRVVVLTTYSTIQRREVVKTQHRFKFADPPWATFTPKRRKVSEVPDADHMTTDADEIANS
ncbi:hypothetical protein GGI42DRAFT_357870 [Trichoderma sp. SZMC 28013]